MSAKPIKRKIQVSNGFYLDLDQLARLIHTVAHAEEGQKITFAFFEEETGLPFRQVENRLSMGRAMGVFVNRSLGLTPFGKLVAQSDTFFESKGTLEFMHYLAASREKHLVWFDVFNDVLVNHHPMDYGGWLDHFRKSLVGQYSERTLRRHISEEVRFLIEAYTENRFSKLELVYKDSEGKLSPRRYLEPTLMIFSAMLYDYGAKQHTNLLQMEDLIENPGSPGRVFFLGREVLSSTIESLHDLGYVRYERTHNLNQVRLKEEYNVLAFLRAFYHGEEPESSETVS